MIPAIVRDMNCAVYARVSTDDQNCEMQLRELREYCARRGWKIVHEYVDTGWSGKLAKRPQLDRVMRDAGEHRFDAVLVWKLDRWGRSLAHLIESIQVLRSQDVRWIATTQNLDTGDENPMSRAMLGMMAVFAEFEREMIRERVIAGLNAARHRGKVCGRPKKVFDRKRALDMLSGGASVRKVAKAFGVGIGTVARLRPAR
jgi:DNA invertase Pin-like site-specific DNA recombinase